jgi:hypothetical protein
MAMMAGGADGSAGPTSTVLLHAQHWQTVLRRVDRLESELLAERAARQQLERQLRRTAAEFEAVAQRCERASQVAAAAEETAQCLAGASQVEHRERWAAVEARLQVRGDTFQRIGAAAASTPPPSLVTFAGLLRLRVDGSCPVVAHAYGALSHVWVPLRM